MYEFNPETHKANTFKIKDRREQLRVKIMSLAEEARIIRKEERKFSWPGVDHNPLREELYLHRIGTVRSEARSAVLAYGFIRGLTYEKMEPNPWTGPDWSRVKTLVKKYGPRDFTEPPEFSKPPVPRMLKQQRKRIRQTRASAQV